jgi:hypothetical protein
MAKRRTKRRFAAKEGQGGHLYLKRRKRRSIHKPGLCNTDGLDSVLHFYKCYIFVFELNTIEQTTKS